MPCKPIYAVEQKWAFVNKDSNKLGSKFYLSKKYQNTPNQVIFDDNSIDIKSFVLYIESST